MQLVCKWYLDGNHLQTQFYWLISVFITVFFLHLKEWKKGGLRAGKQNDKLNSQTLKIGYLLPINNKVEQLHFNMQIQFQSILEFQPSTQRREDFCSYFSVDYIKFKLLLTISATNLDFLNKKEGHRDNNCSE